MNKFVRNTKKPAGDPFREMAWEEAALIRSRLSEPVSAEYLTVEILAELGSAGDTVTVHSSVCSALISLVQAGLVDVVDA